LGKARTLKTDFVGVREFNMEEMFKEFASHLALGVEVVAVLVIAYGAVEAVLALIFRQRRDPVHPFAPKKQIWLKFGVWLLLGLEFELAADIVRTAIAPTWHDIGQLASIALIRTFLNYFLEKDIEKYAEEGVPENGAESQNARAVPDYQPIKKP
jgi:uncharacterized membrane protein